MSRSSFEVVNTTTWDARVTAEDDPAFALRFNRNDNLITLDCTLEDGERHGSARRRVERWREIGVGAQILRDLGIGSIALLATREQHYVGLSGFGIEITRMLRIDDEG